MTKENKHTDLQEELRGYYLPTLRNSMKSARKYALEHDSDHHHGMANAFEIAIGCIEEALDTAKQARSIDEQALNEARNG